MKRLISIIILLFFISDLFGQIDFKGDSSTNNKTISTLYYLIDSTFKLDKTFDFEFRLCTTPSLVSYSNVFILTETNGIWKARFFEYYGNHKIKISEIKVDQTELKGLWTKLYANQVLTLPTQDSIKNRMKTFVADTAYSFEEGDTYENILITDGTVYHFDLFTQHKMRAYEYHCPKGYLKHYPNMEELYRAFNIILLIRKYLGLNLEIC